VRLLLVLPGVVDRRSLELPVEFVVLEFKEPDAPSDPEPEMPPEAVASRDVDVLEFSPLFAALPALLLVEGNVLLVLLPGEEESDEGAGAALLPMVGPAGEPKLPEPLMLELELAAAPLEAAEGVVVDDVFELEVCACKPSAAANNAEAPQVMSLMCFFIGISF